MVEEKTLDELKAESLEKSERMSERTNQKPKELSDVEYVDSVMSNDSQED